MCTLVLLKDVFCLKAADDWWNTQAVLLKGGCLLADYVDGELCKLVLLKIGW